MKVAFGLGDFAFAGSLGAGLALKVLGGEGREAVVEASLPQRFSARNSNSTGSVTGRAATLGTPSSPALSNMRLSSCRALKGRLLISSISWASLSSLVSGLGREAANWPRFLVRSLGL